MDTPMYIRSRGRVLGPYDQEKLQQLARRGQLSRLHELSPDGVTWAPAANYPELFAVTIEVRLPEPAVAPRADSGPTYSLNGPVQPCPPSGGDGPWHYSRDGSQGTCQGKAGLQQMIYAGLLGADDLVWSQGMAEWAPARTVPGLAFPGQSGPSSTAAEPARDGAAPELDRDLCKAAVQSRPWVVFLAVVAFVYAALNALLGMLMVLQGAGAHAPAAIATGLFMLVAAGVSATGAALLLGYATHLGKLGYRPAPSILAKALESLRSFWVFTSIVLIVNLAFVAFVVIWVIAVGASFAGML